MLKSVFGNYIYRSSPHFIYGYIASDIQIVRDETRCRDYMGYTFQLAARDILYAPSHREDSIYYSLCYTNRGALAGTRNSPVGPP